ncbi:unnamed protein product [Lathyrus oleraceus]
MASKNRSKSYRIIALMVNCFFDVVLLARSTLILELEEDGD